MIGSRLVSCSPLGFQKRQTSPRRRGLGLRLLVVVEGFLLPLNLLLTAFATLLGRSLPGTLDR